MAQEGDNVEKLLEKVTELIQEVKEDKNKEKADPVMYQNAAQHPTPRILVYQTETAYQYAPGMNIPTPQPYGPQYEQQYGPQYGQHYGPQHGLGVPPPVYAAPMQPYPVVYHYDIGNPGRRGRRTWRPRRYYGYQY